MRQAHPGFPTIPGKPTRAIQLLLLFLLASFSPLLSAITLTGSNGRAVEFAGLKEATPKGITAQVSADADLIGIPWSRLDLDALKEEHPLIFAAYQSTRKGETVALNLGTFESKEGMAMEGATRPPRKRFPGWEDVDIGGVTFGMQLPPGKANAILFVALGPQGESIKFLTGFDFGTGIFGKLQKEEGLALMSYSINHRDPDPRKMPDVAFAGNGLADQVLEAVSRIASKSNRPDLVDLPFLVYGTERFGATVAYSFVQAKPELVLAAVCSKGAFYRAEPTPESAAVPILFLWGEYSNNYEIWGTEHNALSALERANRFPTAWTGAREFRGSGDINSETEYLGQEYLRQILPLRMRESKGAGEESEGAQAWIEPLDREKGYVGVFDGVTFEKISGPEAMLEEEGQTFLPHLSFAKLWKAYGEGSFEVPE